MDRNSNVNEGARRGPLVSAATLLGVGLGGLLNGIVLHQLLQWHNMQSSKVPPVDIDSMQHNLRWDGIFYAATWVAVAVGLALLFRASKQLDVVWSTRAFVGSLALGWGLISVVEGIINHHILDWHHVRHGDSQGAWDAGYLAFGALLILIGSGVIRAAREETTRRHGLSDVEYAAQARHAHAVSAGPNHS